jgi:hypothetical protein
MSVVLNVALQNHPGSLAEILTILSKAEINVDAIDADAHGDFGTVHLFTNKPKLARELLEQDGYDVVEAEAIELQLPNKYGELARLAETLAKAKVNVVSLFGTSPPHGGEGRLLLRVNNARAAREALGLKGV